MYGYIFRALMLGLILTGCDNIPRDNVLDPKNDDSYAQSVILVEAFVNASPAQPYPYSEWAVNSLRALQNNFDDRVVVVEYHRDLLINDSTIYDDPYNTSYTDNFFNQMHTRYVEANSIFPKGVPDVFVNGAMLRYTGAAGPSSIEQQINPEITELIAQKNYFLIEPEINRQGNTFSVKCRVAALGNRSADDIRMRLIFITEHAAAAAFSVANDVSWPGMILKDIEKGSYIETDLGDYSFSELPDAAVFAIMTEDELTVLQTTKWVL